MADDAIPAVEYLTMSAAVAASGASESTLRRRIRAGDLRAANVGGAYRIERTSLEETFPRAAAGVTSMAAAESTAGVPARVEAWEAVDRLAVALAAIGGERRRALAGRWIAASAVAATASIAGLAVALVISRADLGAVRDDLRQAGEAVQEAARATRDAEAARETLAAEIAAQRAAAGQDKAEIERLAGALAQAEKAVAAVRAEGDAGRQILQDAIRDLAAALAAGRTAGSDRPSADVPGGTGGVSGTPEKLDGGTPVPAAAHVEDPAGTGT